MENAGTLTLSVAFAVFVVGVIFNAGRLSARVDALEKAQEKYDAVLDSIRAAVRHIETLLMRGSG